MTSLITSKEYNAIPVDAFSNIFSFLSYQHSQQVSRVNQDALIASQFSNEKADKAARVIQRGFRRWKVMLRFAMSLESTTDEGGHFPEKWEKYFRTSMGKDFGKRLFMSYCHKFLYRITNQQIIRRVFNNLIKGLYDFEFLNAEEQLKVRDVQYDLHTKEYDDYVSGSIWNGPEIFLRVLVEKVVLPYIDREGAEMVFHTRLFFGRTTPPVWSKKSVSVDWVNPTNTWLEAVFTKIKYQDVFDL